MTWKRTTFRYFAALATGTLTLLAGAGASLANSGAIRVGEPFPEIAMPTLDGEMRSISDYRGRKVVLHVFASW